MKNLLLNLLLILVVSSCQTLEQKCLERFPQQTAVEVRETTRTDTIILPWHTVEIIDTTICPPATEPTMIVKTITKEVPGETIYHEVQCIDTVMVLRDQPKINYLTAQVSSLETSLAQATGKTKTSRWIIIALSVFCLLFILLALLAMLSLRKRI